MFKNIRKSLKNQDGFTLIEILVVISIIAILFVTLLPKIDFAGDKARQTGVKTDFKTFQDAGYVYLNETAAVGMNYHTLNTFLDEAMQIEDGGTKTGEVYESTTQAKDPWGQKYDVTVDAKERKIIFKSWGKTEDQTKPDYLAAVYYSKGSTGRCTDGFDTGDVTLEAYGDMPDTWTCGDNLPG